MSTLNKSSLTVDGNSVHMAMPFSKVDKANRLVSGYATLDNIDTQGDIVLAEASAKAFSRARGNIREMHQPIAVGKMVDFVEKEFFHKGKFYRGIYVTARVSEGAEDTWKKVLDGTLTGFSIGGEINEASNEFVKEAQKTVRFIKDYDLVELSLVDNPANQLANIFSIEKSSNGNSMLKGMVSETLVENVFICPKDQTVVVKDSESEVCPNCDSNMENAGWFETGGDRAVKVQDVINKYLAPLEKEATPSSDEGGVDMGTNKEENKETEPVGEVVVEDESTDDEETTDVDEVDGDDEAEAESPDEIVDDETEISKKIDELHDAVKTSLEDVKVETLKKVSELEGKIDEATQSFLTKATELESRMSEFGEKIETQKTRLAEMEGRLEKMNSSDAFRKSADVESSPVKNVQNNTFWSGAFSD